MDPLTLIIGITLGVVIGLYLPNSPLAPRLGLGTQARTAKEIANEVLVETSGQTQGMLNDTVRQINEQVRQLQDKVQSLETSNATSMASLSENVRSVADIGRELSSKTHGLETALRNNSTAGRWGEVQLRRLVELSGMTQYVDFYEQVTSNGHRPDMVIRFANNSMLPVDSKVSLNAYLDGVAAGDAETRKAKAMEQFRALKAHVDELVTRKYHDGSDSLPFTVMFVQVEGSLSFADEARGDKESVVDYALSKNIIIATPGTLMALLRTAQFSWRQRSEVANALQLLDAVKELGKRMDSFIGHLGKHAKAIHDVQESYGKLVSSWNSRALPQLTRINELRADTIDTVPELTPPSVEISEVRRLQGDGG
jgi:DNA recombination protein RmuC